MSEGINTERKIEPMGNIEDLIHGYKLLQREPHCKLGMDAILLAAYLSPSKAEYICDLGSGGGAVAVLLAARYPKAKIDGVEIQASAADLMQDNIALNRLEDRVRSIRGDLRQLADRVPAGTYSAVVCNPPYFPVGAGAPGGNQVRRIERSEETATLQDVCNVSAYLLKHGGELAVVYRTERLCDVMVSMRNAGIEPKRLTFIQATTHQVPKLLLVSGRKNAAPGLITEPPFLIQREDGTMTEECQKVYAGGRI